MWTNTTYCHSVLRTTFGANLTCGRSQWAAALYVHYRRTPENRTPVLPKVSNNLETKCNLKIYDFLENTQSYTKLRNSKPTIVLKF
jgi:hypothetical protein